MIAVLRIFDIACETLILLFLVASIGYLRGWRWLP